MTEARLFSRHSIGTRIAALFMLLILVITAAMTYVSISVSTNELLDSSTEYTEQLIRRVNAELDMYVEYMKDISDFIVDNGAVAAYLRAANEHRLTDAACREAQEQLAAIRRIEEGTGLRSLPEKLQQAAQLRLEYPEASLSELSAISQPHVTKSCLGHRLKKLVDMTGAGRK